MDVLRCIHKGLPVRKKKHIHRYNTVHARALNQKAGSVLMPHLLDLWRPPRLGLLFERACFGVRALKVRERESPEPRFFPWPFLACKDIFAQTFPFTSFPQGQNFAWESKVWGDKNKQMRPFRFPPFTGALRKKSRPRELFPRDRSSYVPQTKKNWMINSINFFAFASTNTV